MTASAKRITALFYGVETAERAYEACAERGYEIGDVNVVMSDDTRRHFQEDDSEVTTLLAQKKAEGGELGGPKGMDTGIAITIAAAVAAAVALPVLGFVAAGPLAAALTGAGAAGVAAGLVGALSDWGVPEERVRLYEAGISKGGVLMAVEAKSAEDARQIEEDWLAIGGRDVYRG